MGQSQRHHYIPQFLIKNFSNDKSKLYVYYKEKKEIKETVPKSIFLTGTEILCLLLMEG